MTCGTNAANIMSRFTHEERLALTDFVLSLLSSWGVRDADQISLLALPSDTRTRAMRKYRDGLAPLPDDPQIFQRIEHLIGIADALRTSYPRNATGGAMWMNRPNERFANRAPIDAMIEDDLTGITEVRIHLDCAYDWHVNGA